MIDKLLGAVKGATPIFWYKVGIVALIFVAYTAGVATWATHRCELKHEQQKTEQAEKKTEEVIRTITERVPVIQKVEVESAKQRQEINRLKESLDETLKNRPENSSCDLSNAELDGVRKLAEKTHIR